MPICTPSVLRISWMGSSISPIPRRNELITPVVCSSTVQAYVRTSRLDQNGRRTATPRTVARRGPAWCMT